MCLTLCLSVCCDRQTREVGSRTAGQPPPSAAPPERSDLTSLLESSRGSLTGAGFGLGFRMSLPKMPSFRVGRRSNTVVVVVCRWSNGVQLVTCYFFAL